MYSVKGRVPSVQSHLQFIMNRVKLYLSSKGPNPEGTPKGKGLYWTVYPESSIY